MKKPVKIAFWSVGVILGLVLIIAIIFMINFISATKAMTPAETQPLNDSVWCIKDRFVNAFIFKGREGYLMVDAGINAKNFSKELSKTGLLPEQITTLLLTHTDSDHIGATGLLKNADIYMHKDEEQMINGSTGKTKFSKTVWKYGPYKLLNNNENLILNGLNVKIIHTPGHTPGSSCYVIGKDYLVTGDNLVIVNGKYEHFVDKYNMDTPEQEKSLKMLPEPGTFKYIMTGHNGIIKNP
ncbi:MAG TPA: MBL fold metallo-hydrolase [Bacteroidales bacterium]|nr:MBL fold metallo-hydrolase [Bacteroidales bacterium]